MTANSSSDSSRLDWLEQHSYAFVYDRKTGKGFIRLSDDYIDHPSDDYNLRAGLDDAIHAEKVKCEVDISRGLKTISPGFADVNCGQCRHPMSVHTGAKFHESGECEEPGCNCALGPARRDDLVDEIEALKNKLAVVQESEAEENSYRLLAEKERDMLREALTKINAIRKGK